MNFSRECQQCWTVNFSNCATIIKLLLFIQITIWNINSLCLFTIILCRHICMAYCILRNETKQPKPKIPYHLKGGWSFILPSIDHVYWCHNSAKKCVIKIYLYDLEPLRIRFVSFRKIQALGCLSWDFVSSATQCHMFQVPCSPRTLYRKRAFKLRFITPSTDNHCRIHYLNK